MNVGEFSASDVDRAYHELGHQYGWSLMATPADRLRTARVAIVGLNPGDGGATDTFNYGGLWDFQGENAYFDERWGPNGTNSPLQIQVREWHRLLRLKPTDSLCIQLVPFRSPNWSSLPEQEKSLEFSQSLWRWILQVSPATLFVTMGKLPARHLAGLIPARHFAQLPTGWGRQMIDVYDGPSGRRIVAMPHPSRYRLFKRAAGGSEVAERSFLIACGSEP